MKFNGLFKEAAKKEEEKFFLRLVAISSTEVELRAVDEKGEVLDAGHLMKFEKLCGGKVKASAYSSVSTKIPLVLDDSRALKIEVI